MLTVALCTYNPSEKLLLKALDSVVGQLETVSELEILVIDNNSQPSIAELGYVSSYPIRLIREPRPGLTAARECAIRSAHGNVLLFVDDDNVLRHGYLARTAARFAADAKLGLLGGSVVPEYVDPPPRWLKDFEPQLAIRRYPPDFYRETTDIPYSEFFPVGAGFAVRRDLARAYVQDCESTGRIEGRRGEVLSAGEDLDLGLFVLRSEHKLAVDGALQVKHIIPAARMTTGYVRRVMVGSLQSTVELERKWAIRFGRPVFTTLTMPLAELVLKTAAAWVLSPWSPRYRVKFHVFLALTRARLRMSTSVPRSERRKAGAPVARR